MVDRTSALEGHYNPGHIGREGETGVVLTEIRDLTLHQVAAWPETLITVGEQAAAAVGTGAAPGPCQSASGDNGALLRIEPLKWWVYGVAAPQLATDDGATLDLSHSRTHVRVSGENAAALINRVLPLDLRESSFPVGSVASSALHHVGVTLWRTDEGYDLFIPRGFALAVWEILLETAAQFGAEIA